MENKETSIQWLMSQAIGWVRNTNNGNDHIEFPKGAIEQAKAMHKEELEFAFKGGMSLVEGILWKPIDKFEEFYNEKFNNEQ